MPVSITATLSVAGSRTRLPFAATIRRMPVGGTGSPATRGTKAVAVAIRSCLHEGDRGIALERLDLSVGELGREAVERRAVAVLAAEAERLLARVGRRRRGLDGVLIDDYVAALDHIRVRRAGRPSRYRPRRRPPERSPPPAPGQGRGRRSGRPSLYLDAFGGSLQFASTPSTPFSRLNPTAEPVVTRSRSAAPAQSIRGRAARQTVRA